MEVVVAWWASCRWTARVEEAQHSTALESGGGEAARGQLAGSIIHGPRDIFVA